MNDNQSHIDEYPTTKSFTIFYKILALMCFFIEETYTVEKNLTQEDTPTSIEIRIDKQGSLLINEKHLRCTLCKQPATRLVIQQNHMSCGCELHPQGEDTPEAQRVEKRKNPLFNTRYEGFHGKNT